MTGGSITFTAGREWWLKRTTKAGRNRYPERIVVGDGPDKGRVYVPEKKDGRR